MGYGVSLAVLRAWGTWRLRIMGWSNLFYLNFSSSFRVGGLACAAVKMIIASTDVQLHCVWVEHRTEMCIAF